MNAFVEKSFIDARSKWIYFLIYDIISVQMGLRKSNPIFLLSQCRSLALAPECYRHAVKHVRSYSEVLLSLLGKLAQGHTLASWHQRVPVPESEFVLAQAG